MENQLNNTQVLQAIKGAFELQRMEEALYSVSADDFMNYRQTEKEIEEWRDRSERTWDNLQKTLDNGK